VRCDASAASYARVFLGEAGRGPIAAKSRASSWLSEVEVSVLPAHRVGSVRGEFLLAGRRRRARRHVGSDRRGCLIGGSEVGPSSRSASARSVRTEARRRIAARVRLARVSAGRGARWQGALGRQLLTGRPSWFCCSPGRQVCGLGDSQRDVCSNPGEVRLPIRQGSYAVSPAAVVAADPRDLLVTGAAASSVGWAML